MTDPNMTERIRDAHRADNDLAEAIIAQSDDAHVLPGGQTADDAHRLTTAARGADDEIVEKADVAAQLHASNAVAMAVDPVQTVRRVRELSTEEFNRQEVLTGRRPR
jgi:capsule polysaccharide export protein KpsC/LpsZ